MLGIEVPEVELLETEKPIVCTKSFDRDVSQSTRKIGELPVPSRLHQEDFRQAMGTAPKRKNEEGHPLPR